MDTPPGIGARHRVRRWYVAPDGAGIRKCNANAQAHMGTRVGFECGDQVRPTWPLLTKPFP
jgi:hypothetical protein